MKQRTAFAHRWTTPFSGRATSSNYRNASGSVDRRFFMIEFNKKVRDSDPHLLSKFYQNIDLFQRKGVYLYHQALRKFRDKDIWAAGVVGRSSPSGGTPSSSRATCSTPSSPNRGLVPQTSYMPLDSIGRVHGVPKVQRRDGQREVDCLHYQGVFAELGVYVDTSTQVYPRGSASIRKRRWLHGIDVADDP